MDERVRFELLGPLRGYVGSREITVSGVRERILLATLLLHARDPVAMPLLIESIWGDRPPRNARNQVQGCVSRVRKVLTDAGGSGRIIVTDPNGYHARVDRRDVDLYRFRRLRDEARSAIADGNPDEASRRYRSALALWRGPALSDIDSALISQAVTAINEERVHTLEVCLEIELSRGAAGELVPELTEYTQQHPYQERLHAALMLALYRAGRHADALAAYRHVRQLFHDDLGTELGEDLTRLHRSILNREPTLGIPRQIPTPLSAPSRGFASPPDRRAAFVASVPRTLPAGGTDYFAGRAHEVTLLRDSLRRADRTDVAVVAVAGRGGVGKTALCLQVAHGLLDEYCDGQLYADLRGLDRGASSTPLEILGRFLRLLGVDGSAMPESVDERAELYRDLLADRKVLVVLDNAADEGQVSWLIPGGRECGVMINSRARIGASLGARTVDLEVLDAAGAVDLLVHLVGETRAEADPAAVAQLARLCGHLPLALRVAGGRLAAKPHWSLSKLVHLLGDERSRLDQLSQGHLDVRASMAMSYGGLSQDAQRLLRRLGDLDLPEVSSWISAALLDCSVDRAEAVLEQLFDAQLVLFTGAGPAGHAKYRLHDLLRLFARERAELDETPQQLAEARKRAFGASLFVVEAAYRAICGGDYQNIRGKALRWAVDEHQVASLVANPLRWFESDLPTIMTLVRRAADTGCSAVCWELVSTSSLLFQMCRHFDDWSEVLDIALTVARRDDDRRGEAAIHYRMGWLCADRTENEKAKGHFEEAAALFAGENDRHGHATVTAYLGMIERFLGNEEEALVHYCASLPVLHDLADYGGAAFVLRGIGQVHLQRGHEAAAEESFARALEVYRSTAARQGRAQVLGWQGMLLLRQSQYPQARAKLQEALEIARSLGDRPGQAHCLQGLGLCYQQEHDLDRARDTLLTALELVRQPCPTIMEGRIRDALASL